MGKHTPIRTASTPTPRRLSIRTAISAGIAAAALLATPAATAATAQDATRTPVPPQHNQPTQQVEYFTGAGTHPRHTTVPAPEPLSPSEKAAIASDGDVTPIVQNGPVETKLDVVFIGDGYTAAQQEDFHDDVRAKWAKISAVDPYASYTTLFNVWAVDAVSNDSGVSGDPTQDVVRDTALDSAFFCSGIERLLCVDTGKVESYASKAPAADLVVVLSNSTKYGGAGYNDISSQLGYDGIATASSDNDRSDQIAVHETGHSLGKLADEYDYGQPGTYTGPEPAEANITTFSADEMTARQQKWYRWIGEQSPDGGTVGAYEGGGYYRYGLNRPTENSLMRTLGREFNLPGREAMIAGFYRYADVLTSPVATDRILTGQDRMHVTVPASVQVTWLIDGHETKSSRGRTTVTPRTLGVPADGRTHTVTAKAIDRTHAVRDPALRKLLSGSLKWRVAR
ncbi:M64 family metallopeptidase [Streptomyces halobius]|uniref:M64 family metallopeptidase n=1 Tax=Streptomyces halobius TaxID=2879846 RepID=A0ABY4MI46_9ACTN|nr:M64 family metallopeptidase [Streptomyces halobius]UQA97418.1 M64 family metallopeptidase [Streptomyces halobius]